MTNNRDLKTDISIDAKQQNAGAETIPLQHGNHDAALNASNVVTAMRKSRRVWIAGLPLCLFFYIVFYCNSAILDSLSINTSPLDSVIVAGGGGFRKLLEEKARLAEKRHSNGTQRRLPQCIIIGVRKCGTRALLEFLNLHPRIQAADQEIHFFDNNTKYHLGLDWYMNSMPSSRPDQVTLEKTPKYFVSHVAPSRIWRMNNSVKLVVLLRHPTTRVISDYTQIYYNKLGKNETLEEFEKLVLDPYTGEINTHYKAVQVSVYHQHLSRWFNIFSKDQVHIVDGDNLVTDPVSEIKKVEKFLGLDHRITYDSVYFNQTRGFYCYRVNRTMERCLGASKGRKHPDIDPVVVKKLNKFFKPHNERLFRMISRQFSWS
ncbi:heparan sulfate glucosamine 3-O-sulfotransferase 5-like [Gigantopelta aegis]|uniref:heparan sulfate glucosamine 3-O-sulfotransferase 5-like n=1 Tax=Gigantopelta aegis TaxID=1735272 RepID=UPI001B889F73|nr:heparan sulfate glucosamine 3-O-sulfotransferase 5-like [Gigantopelta aegis]XP_041358951.1 heparan sulfate glucosamine 3-O-sulfotransferase 5-like [Gigantopelta aegis]